MKTLLQAAGAVALLAIATFFLTLASVAHDAQRNIHGEITAIHRDLGLVLNGDPDSGTSVGMLPLRERLVVAAGDQVGGLREDIRGMVGDLRKSTFQELDDIRSDAREQLSGIRTDALAAVDKGAAPVNKAAGTIEQLRKDLAPILEHAGSIAKHVDEA